MRTREPVRTRKETDQNLNRREEVFKRPGFYLIVTPPLHNGFCFSVLYDRNDVLIAKAKRPMTAEGRQQYARAYIDGMQNE